MINKEEVFRSALDSYYIHTSMDGDVNKTWRLKSISKCKDHISCGEDITSDWIKENYRILLPAFESYRSSLKNRIEDDASSCGKSFWDMDTEEYEYVNKMLSTLYHFQRVVSESI